MNIPTATEMKAELTMDLNEVHQASKDHASSVYRLMKHGVKVDPSRLYLSSMVEEVLKHFFENMCKELTLEADNGTPAEIKLDPSFYSFQSMGSYGRVDADCRAVLNNSLRSNLVSASKKEDCVVIPLLEEVIASIPFKLIETTLRQEASTMLSKGIGMMADKLVDGFNIGSSRRPSKVKGRFVVSETLNYGYSYDRKDEYALMQDTLDIITKETGVVFGQGFNNFTTAFEATNNSTGIASRTVFGKGSNLEIHCFASKYEFRFTYEAFDALSAFVSVHANEKNIQDTLSLSQEILKVA
jgi:hypothetical protein